MTLFEEDKLTKEVIEIYLPKRFIDILNKLGVYDKYCKNVAEQRSFLKWTRDILGKPLDTILVISFTYMMTEEGYVFWQEIDRKIDEEL